MAGIMSPPPGLGGSDGGGSTGEVHQQSQQQHSGGRRAGQQNHRSTPSLSGSQAGGGAQSPSSTSSASSSLLTIVKAQISFLLSTLSDDNFTKHRQDIRDLTEQHGQEAQNHLMRRLILGAASNPTNGSPNALAPSSVLSPTTSSANSISAAQLPLYNRLLSLETKRHASDPFLAERWVAAILSGLNDPSATCSDVFKALDLRALLSLVGLSSFEERVLLAELQLLLLSSLSYGARAVSESAERKRAEFGEQALRILADNHQAGHYPITEFTESIKAAQWTHEQAAKHIGRIASDPWIADSRDELEQQALPFAVETARAIERVFGPETDGIFKSSLEHFRQEMEDSERRSGYQMFIRLNQILLESLPSASAELAQAIVERSDLVHSVAGNAKQLARTISAIMSSLIEGQDVVSGQLFVQGLDGIANKKGHAPLDWVKIVGAIDAELLGHPATVQSWNSAFMNGVFTAPTAKGEPAIKYIWNLSSEPVKQTSTLSTLFRALPSLTATTLPEEYKLIHMPSLHAEVAEQQDYSQSTRTAIESVSAQNESSIWNIRNLLPVLFTLSEVPKSNSEEDLILASTVREMFEHGTRNSPELVLLSILKLNQPWPVTASDLFDRLIAYFLSTPQSTCYLVFHELAKADRPLLVKKLQAYYEESEMNANRILDIAADFSLLSDILEDQEAYFFSLDIASLAGRREILNLEKWLETATAEKGSTFVRAALDFVGHKVRHDLARQDQDTAQASEPTTLSLAAPIIATFLRALRSHHEIFGPEEIELFKEVRTQCLQLHPRLMNFAPGAEQEPGISVTSFSPDIEAEVDAFYKRMYDQEVTVDAVVSLLQRAKESDNSHDHEFLACFLHGLFDEYKFFATYPQQELTLTAFLFGSLIQNHLIDYIPLGIAVRYVLDALRNPPDSNWFRFGIQALSRFQPRLHQWPSFAQAILNIPHLAQAHPDIANVARAALASTEGQENGIDGQLEGSEVAVEEQKTFSALKPDASAAQRGTPEQPDEATSDRILFIVNNLAPTNMEAKVKDMEEKMEDQHYRWFANYIVDQRVSIEPNNHGLYMSFLDALDIAMLFKEIVQETLIRTEELLNSEQTIQSSNQRTLLKNLGSWLGALTLAKNKPIKHKNVSFKDLLIQGYDSNRLIVAIPFVCKVLEQCAKSKIFKPPNPWLMAILRLLVELYQFAELKLNLKFEIEVLCKNLNIDLKDIQPTSTLRDRPPKDILTAEPGSAIVQDLEKGLMNGLTSQATQGAELSLQPRPGQLPQPASGLSLLGASGSATAAGYSLALADAITAALQIVPQYLAFSPQVAAFSSNPTLKRLVQFGVDRAVREIIAPVVERSVTIAGISTRELTIKDFAMEGSDDRMRSAAHLMVQNLAGSLALVTCKEPLRMSIVAHIRSLMLQNGFSEQNLPEQAIMVIANDNLELACSVVEKVAMDKAVVEVDDALAPSYMTRIKHRERSSQAFWDTAAMAASHYSGMLPDPLRLKLGGLQPNQVKVYDEFGKRALSTFLRSESPVTEEPSAAGTQAALQYEGQAPGGLLTAQQSSEIFSQLMNDLDKAVTEAEANGIDSATKVPTDHDIHATLRQVPIVAARSYAKDETTLSFSQKVVQLLYRSETQLAREVFVALLQRLCDVATKVAKEVTAWLIYAPDERKFNVNVTVLLLESGFISVSEYDAQLAKFVMREFRPSVVNFAAQLCRECLLTERAIASREHFSHSLRALAQAIQSGKGGDSAAALLDELRSSASVDAANRSQLDDQAVREQLTMCFVEWVRIYQQSYQIEKAFVEFVVQLQNQGILKGEEISSLFFRVCTEVSVESYIKQKAAGGTPTTGLFQPVDAFAKLITFMIKYHADPQNKNNDQAKVHYMTKVLSIVVLVLAQSHEELGPHFQQKPFYRFFSSLLSNLNQIEMHLGSAYYQILVALSHSINTLQPLFFSGFTFSWMALVSHRLFMPKLLNMKDREGWSSFHRLLISLLRFLAPFSKKGEMSETARAIYLGTVRIILVLLHDFPEFLTVYYYSLSDAIPPSCTQLHNLISSAFPLTTQLPDPLRIKSVADNLAEYNTAPTLLSDFTAALQPADLRAQLEQALQKKVERGASTGLAGRLALPENRQSATETKYNIQLINAIVMFSGSIALGQSKASDGTAGFQASAPAVGLLQNLAEELDPEGSYYVLNAVAMHLRYPNSHSNWFSSWMVHVFTDASTKEYTKEQIVRVLLERLVAHRPHPFSVISTFVQLLKHESFFKHDFVTKSPEVKLLLDNIKNSLTVNGA